MERLTRGSVVWVNLSPTQSPNRRREQRGHRPAVIVSSDDHLDLALNLAIIVPCTTVNRGWPNHVELTGPIGLAKPTFAMTEQPRTISRTRITEVRGNVGEQCRTEITMWLDDWIRASNPSG